MPAHPALEYWIEFIWSMEAESALGVAEGKRPKTDSEILRRIQERAALEGRVDQPTDRGTVKKYRGVFPELTEEQQKGYRTLYWPESFQRGDLEWAAAPPLLELLQVYLSHFDGTERPSTRIAKWYWRVVQSNPNLQFKERLVEAVRLVASEAGYTCHASREEGFYHDPERDRRESERFVLGLDQAPAIGLTHSEQLPRASRDILVAFSIGWGNHPEKHLSKLLSLADAANGASNGTR